MRWRTSHPLSSRGPVLDAHVHWGDDHPWVRALIEELDLKLLNISFAEDATSRWRDQGRIYQTLAKGSAARFAWCTTFDPHGLGNPGCLDQVIGGLQRDFTGGAVGCKIWKNIGMALRKANGEFLLPDDPVLDPIYEFVAAQGKTLLAHVADPVAAWQPLDPEHPDYGYYREHPGWHMYGRPDAPTHEQLMAARNRLLERYPGVRVVGAHLGSLETDLDRLGACLERYPNFAVDLSGRLAHLASQDSARVRDFFLRYQDRLLFGTDIIAGAPLASMNRSRRTGALAWLRETYDLHFAYLETGKRLSIGENHTQGLNLPTVLLDRLYRDNARAWYPGL